MLKIFLSSTYRDLFKIREKILAEVESVLKGIGMEKFVPDGKNSQEKCITELKKSEIVVFLISSYYGSLMDSCLPELKNVCKAECPMKTGRGKISYTHCEYKTTKAEGIHHMAYLIKGGWNEIRDLKNVPDNEINLSELKNIPFFEKMDDELIKHYIKIRKGACDLNEEIGKEFRKEKILRGGTYIDHSQKGSRCDIVILDISLTGLAFSSQDAPNLKIDDELGVEFSLDFWKGTNIKRDVIVKNIRHKRVGCEFELSGGAFDSQLEYYVRS